jgi:hypothetical protein
LQVLSVATLCANPIGIALGFVGVRDQLSSKLYPLLGLILNVAIVVIAARAGDHRTVDESLTPRRAGRDAGAFREESRTGGRAVPRRRPAFAF